MVELSLNSTLILGWKMKTRKQLNTYLDGRRGEDSNDNLREENRNER